MAPSASVPFPGKGTVEPDLEFVVEEMLGGAASAGRASTARRLWAASLAEHDAEYQKRMHAQGAATIRRTPWDMLKILMVKAKDVLQPSSDDGLIDPLARHEAEVELNVLATGLYGFGPQAFRFLMDTLFMTPKHREAHTRMRDDISGRLEKMPKAG